LIILDKPYVSELLADTVRRLQIPVVSLNDVFIPNECDIDFKKIEDLLIELENGNSPILFNSKNGLNILSRYTPNNYLTTVIEILKNKVTFRKVMSGQYKDFFFQEVLLRDLDEIDVGTLPFPVIVKPVMGELSIGIHRVDKLEEYHATIKRLKKEMDAASSTYPQEVINKQSFIIEKFIEGDEYAIDAYFSEDGKPIILNLFKRMLTHEKDMSNRIYYTSKEVMNESLIKINTFLNTISSFFALKMTPIHIEIRIDKEGKVIPFEMNPLRFSEICTNELGVYAYGINAYEYFFKQQKPDWESIVSNMDNSIYSYCCAKINDPMDYNEVEFINHNTFKENFSGILEYRKMNIIDNSTFAVVFDK
jgi:predicted ATP-grasp superfamily ATP-dependent carboligase